METGNIDSFRKISRMIAPELTILLTIIVFAIGCPPPKSIEPCTCENNKLACRSKDLSLEQMTRQLRQANFQTVFKKLKLEAMKLGIVKLHLLDNIKFQSLEVFNCELDGITDEDVEDVQTLKKIDILVSIDETKANFKLILHNLQNISWIRLKNNHIHRIPNDWFGEETPSLKYLLLSENHVEYIEDKAFSHLVNLTNLDLSKNRLKSIKRSMLPASGDHLKSLNLGSNHLTVLPNDLFSGLTSLAKIDLRKNELKHLPEETWKSIWPRLWILTLKENPLDCSASIEWIAVSPGPDLTGRCAAPGKRKGMKLEHLRAKLRRQRRLPSNHFKKSLGKPHPILLPLLFRIVLPFLPLFKRG